MRAAPKPGAVPESLVVYPRVVFLHRLLDPEARRGFAGLAYHLLHLGSDITAHEARLVFTMLAELELAVDDLATQESFDALAARISHPRARRAALLELVRLARSDRELQPDELATVRWLAVAWGIPEEELASILDWVERHVRMVREAERLIERAG